MTSGASSLDIGLFGTLVAESHGSVLPIPGERQQRLLARLALAKGSPVGRATLAEAVWGDGDAPPDPGTGLRSYASRLRGALGQAADLIETVDGGYRLSDEASTDVERFETHLRRGRHLADTGLTEQAVDELAAALQLATDTLLVRWGHEPWVVGEARRLAESRLVAAGHKAELQLSLGGHDLAVEDLTPLNAQHPHHEGVARRLAAALHAQGRSGDALAVIAECRRRLLTDLGLDPSPDLVDLESSILDPGSPPAGTSRRNGRPGRATAGQQLRSYELGERIGEGSFSIVYRGRQPSVDRDVAIKVIRSELANDGDFVRRFEVEAQLVAGLEHPHIVPLYDFWREPNAAYLVMRWLRGGTLHSRLSDVPLAPAEAVRMVSEIGDGLALAHARGVVHRDVKPANVFLDERGRFYLGDFGIAVDAQYGPDPVAALSLGSPAYASPEQLTRQEVSPATDVYSLAVTAYEAMAGRLPFDDAATRAELVRRQLDEDFPPLSSLLPGLPPSIDEVMAAATAKDPTERLDSVLTFVERFQAALAPEEGLAADVPTRRGRATWTADTVCPYVGLAAFGEGDADRFFGRTRLTNQLVETMQQSRMTMVVGPSGSGKSSLVRAGLVPRVRSGALPHSDSWFVVTMTPGADPYEELEAALLRVAVNPPPSLREQLLVDDRGIARSVRRVLPDELPDGRAELLLVIDQFEELFTQCESEELRRSFLRAVATAVEDERARFRVVATIRADYYDRPLRYPELAQILRSGTVPITPLAPDELERVIVDPADRAGVEFEPGLVPTIVAEVNDQAGALPLLQFTLTRLWDHQVSGLLTMTAYAEIGGVSGALAAEAEARYLGLGPQAQQAAPRLFQRLVTPGEGRGDTRRRALRTELLSIPDAESVVDTFGQARLLSFDRDHDSRQPTVELAHEALLREWPRLADWIDENRDGLRIHRHLTAAAAGWRQRGQDRAELYRGGRLEAATDFAATNPLGDEEQSFLDASRAEADAVAATERRRASRLRLLATSTAVIAALAVIASVVAVGQQRRADDNAQQAEAASDLAASEAERATAAATAAETALADAEIATLVSRSAALVDENPTASLLLAVEAFDREDSSRTTGALASALEARVGETLRRRFDPIDHVHCEEGAPAHNSFLVPSFDGWVGWQAASEVWVVDPTTGQEQLHTTTDPCSSISWGHADGPLVHEVGGVVSVERVPGSGQLTELIEVPLFFGAVASSGPDGAVVIAGGPDPSTAEFHLFGPDDRPVASPLALGIDIAFAHLSASGRYGLAAGGSANEFQGQTIELFDATTGQSRWSLDLTAQLSWVAFNPDDTVVAIADRAGTVTLVSVESGQVSGTVSSAAGAVTGVTFLDAQRLALATGAGIEVWSTAGPTRQHQIPLSGADLVNAIDAQRLTVTTRDHAEMVVLDLTQTGLASRMTDLGPGTRAFISIEGIAGLASVPTAQGQLVDLATGERTTHPLGLDEAGIVIGIAPRRTIHGYTAFTIDGVVASIEDGVETNRVRLGAGPNSSIRQARGHRTDQDESRVAVYVSDFESADPGRVYLIDLDSLDILLEADHSVSCSCGGVLPTPDGTGLLIDTGTVLTIHQPDGTNHTIDVTPAEANSVVNHGAHPATNRLLRGTSDGTVELIDVEAGTARPIDEFGTAIDNVSFIGAGRAAVVTDAGEAWIVDLGSGQRVGRVWRGGSGDESAGAPVVGAEGEMLWIPTSTEIVGVPLDPEQWRHQACQLAGRELTDEEWAELVPGEGPARSLCQPGA